MRPDRQRILRLTETRTLIAPVRLMRRFVAGCHLLRQGGGAELTIGDLAISSRPGGSPVDRIRAQAKAQVDQYLQDRETGQTTSREIKEVIESIISTDYDGRTVIELLQNAHDAHPRSASTA